MRSNLRGTRKATTLLGGSFIPTKPRRNRNIHSHLPNRTAIQHRATSRLGKSRAENYERLFPRLRATTPKTNTRATRAPQCRSRSKTRSASEASSQDRFVVSFPYSSLARTLTNNRHAASFITRSWARRASRMISRPMLLARVVAELYGSYPPNKHRP